MRTRFLRGTTAQNNGLTLGVGELSIDLERKAVRLHDGQTLGGFEVLGTPIDFPVPGPSTLVTGDTNVGFYGEINATDFIGGDALSTAVGLSAGSLRNDASPWLKCAFGGKTVFISKLILRQGVQWEIVYQTGAVYGDDTTGLHPMGTPVTQNATVIIGGITYRVRLMRGSNTDPHGDTAYNTTTAPGTDLSEWDQLIVGLTDGRLGNYTALDLDIPAGTLNNTVGFSTLCIENHPYSINHRVARGYGGSVTMLGATAGGSDSGGIGWRPVLEPIS